MGVSQNYGYLFGDPHNKDYSISGSILGSPYFGKTTISLALTLTEAMGGTDGRVRIMSPRLSSARLSIIYSVDSLAMWCRNFRASTLGNRDNLLGLSR